MSLFADTRLKTMLANIGISHYHYNQDFSKFWPGGYQNGNTTYTAFGEEVLYPGNMTPAEEVSSILLSAPNHWLELMSPNLSYYGVSVGVGPTYAILGPQNGKEACQVTEIPGAGINLSQFFAQYNCSVQTINDSRFVAELAPVCPATSASRS